MGYPKVKFNVIDQTVQGQTAPVGVAAFAGITERGNVGEAVLVRSFEEYRRKFGELLPSSDSVFPLLAKRALDNGAQLYVTRILHLADVNDATSATAVTADGDNSGSFDFSLPIISVDIVADTITVQGDYTDYIANGDSHVVQKAAGGTTNLTVDSVAYSGGFTTVTYTTDIVGGDAASGDTLTWTSVLSATLSYEAKNPGTWGNYVQVEIKRAASGQANKLDIFVRLTGSSNPNVTPSDLNEVIRNFPDTPTAAEIATFNSTQSRFLNITSTPPFTIGVVPPNLLTGGTDDYASINDADYIGSTVAMTGIRAFDEQKGFVKIAVPEITNNIIDNTLLNYAIERGDCLAILAAPPSLSGYDAIDYKKRQGVYATGTEIDNWRATMLFGGIKIEDPIDGTELTINWTGDFIGLSAKKDRNIAAWRSVSGTEGGRGVLSGVNDIVYNLSAITRTQEAEDVVAAGLYPIAKETFNGVTTIYSNGTRNTQVTVSSLYFTNVAELVIYIVTGLTPLVRGKLQNPNDVLTWKEIYRITKEFMQQIQNGRGITAFVYEGDQDVDNVSQATINDPSDIQLGKYKFNLYFDPIEPLEEVEINAIATNAGVLVAPEA